MHKKECRPERQRTGEAIEILEFRLKKSKI